MDWYEIVFGGVFFVAWLLLVTKVLPRFGIHT